MIDLEEARRRFAEEIRFRAHVSSSRLLEAFATIPRELFLDQGPWSIRSDLEPNYWTTENADPVHVYHDVLVAIDESRSLDNGLPSSWARMLDALALREGEQVVHVGCGTGYYSAILSEAVGTAGRVTAIECDAELARKAERNLQKRSNIKVVHGDGCRHDAGTADVIVVNAGTTHPLPLWLESMAPNGRLLLPLTIDARRGSVLLLKRLAAGYQARTLSGIEIFPCEGARDVEADARLRVALWKRAMSCVNSLRREEHEVDESCWLHAEGFCLSRKQLVGS